MFSGHTALHCAILEHRKPSFEGEGFIDNLPIIQALIRHGADPNAQVTFVEVDMVLSCCRC